MEGDNGHSDKIAARLKLVNQIYDTPEGSMSQLTVIPRRLALSLSMMEAFEYDAKMQSGEVDQKLLSEVWRISYYKHMRSVEGEHLMRATALAESQMASEEEEPVEPIGQ